MSVSRLTVEADAASLRAENGLAGAPEPGALARPEPGTGACILLLLGLCALLFLPNTSSLPLADPDEARSGLVVRHMLRTGDWITPHVGGRAFMDKPAPYFWLAAVGTMLTDDVELGGRAVSAVFGGMAVLVTFAFARSVGGNRAGLLAGAILATAPGPLTVARLYRMDMPLVALMWAALWWFWRYERLENRSRGDSRKQWLGFYALAAGATLVKGPVGLGLPSLVVGVYLLLSGRPKRIREFLHAPAMTLYVLIAAPWYVVIYIRQPQYAYEFFVVQNLVRYAGRAMDDKTFPAIYYVAIILGCMMPWTIYLPGALARTFPRRWKDRARDPAMLFGWLAVLVPLAFFMAGRTRLAVYILPVAPPLAAMLAIPAARWVTSHHPDQLYKVGTVAVRVAVVMIALALGGFELYMRWLDAWIVLPLAGALVAVAFMTLSLKHARRGAYFAWATAGATAMLFFAATHTADRMYAYRSMAPLGRVARARAGDGTLLCYFGKRRHSFALYANRTEVRRFCRDVEADQAELTRLLQSGRPVWCLVQDHRAFRQLQAAVDRPLTVLGTNGEYRLVTNEGVPPGTRPAPPEGKP